MVDAQVEAAYTYQGRGFEKPACLEEAIQGVHGPPEVWGWAALGRRIESVPKYREVFFEAHYNLAYCHFRQAQKKVAEADRRQSLQAAEQEVLDFRRRYEEPGGGPWQDRCRQLLRQIRQELGQRG
jgi:hypothetical protein